MVVERFRNRDAAAAAGAPAARVSEHSAMKLYRFPHSCYAWKAQVALELGKVPFEIADVPYVDRTELVEVSGGMHVPVVVADDGRVLRDSRVILETLAAEDERVGALIPARLAGPVWAYSDWTDGPLEDVLFRLASPGIRGALATPLARALFTVMKERRFGAGIVDAWAAQRGELQAKARGLLAPTLRTLAEAPFVVGDRPTLADVALYAQLAMVAYADPALVDGLGAGLGPWIARMRAAGASAFPRPASRA
ncbi:MAG TPA: glutathione S-transferase [Haliangiales bacterium]|nr:glutathione S-transferase [Haliangiales bacterium]